VQTHVEAVSGKAIGGTGPRLHWSVRPRLARSTADLLNIIQAIENRGKLPLSRGAMGQHLIGGRQTDADGGIAEFERDLIPLRTNEGRARARQSGIKFGPKFRLSPHQLQEIRQRMELGESCRFLARSYGVSPNTISRVRRSYLARVTPNSQDHKFARPTSPNPTGRRGMPSDNALATNPAPL